MGNEREREHGEDLFVLGALVLPQEEVEQPGRWFGTRRTTTRAGTERQYRIQKWGNPNRVLRVYEFVRQATVYYGKTKGGTGYQVVFPFPLDPSQFLRHIGEMALK